jgi:hypothetical protein
MATDDDRPPATTTAAAQWPTSAPMPSPSEIVVRAPPPPELPPAAGDAGADAASASNDDVPGGNLDNLSIKKALHGRVVSGQATIDEIRMLKAACSQLGDRACRDMAAAALQKKLAE